MIRINLLPVRASKKRELGALQIGAGLLALVAVVAVNYLWLGQYQSELDDRRQLISQTRAEIAELDETIGEIQDIERRQEEVQRKLDVLADLEAGRTGPVRVLDEFANLIPPDVWVDRFNESGGEMSLNGYAMRHDDLAAFIRALEESPYFRSIELQSAQLGSRDGLEVVSFGITGRVTYTI